MSFQVTARLTNSRLTCGQKSKMCVDIHLQFMKMLSCNLKNVFQWSSQAVLKSGPRQAAVALLQTPLNLGGGSNYSQEECDAAGCQPVPETGQRDYSASLLKRSVYC